MEYKSAEKAQEAFIQDDQPYDPERAAAEASTRDIPKKGMLTTIRGFKPEITSANKKVVVTAVAIASFIVLVALIQVFTPKKETLPASDDKTRQQNTPAQAKPTLPDSVSQLPSSYITTPDKDTAKKPSSPTSGSPSSIPGGVPQLGTPMPGVVPAPGTVTPEAARAAGLPSTTVQPGQAQPIHETEPISPAEARKEEMKKKSRELIENARKSPILAPMGGANNTKTSPAPAAPAPAVDPFAIASRLNTMTDSQPKQEPQQDQNRQDEKKSFLKEKSDKTSYVSDVLHAPLSPYEVKAGTIIPIVMITGINSDLPGEIVAQVRENVYDTVSGKHLLIPQGTKIKGIYDSQIAYAQDRVLVVWHRLMLPNGNSINLENMPGVDLSGYAGYKDQVNNHWGRIAGSAILSSVFGVATKYKAGQPDSTLQNLTPQQAAGQAAGDTINNVGQKITTKSLDLQPTIEIRMGHRYNILVNKDLILKPYS